MILLILEGKYSVGHLINKYCKVGKRISLNASWLHPVKIYFLLYPG